MSSVEEPAPEHSLAGAYLCALDNGRQKITPQRISIGIDSGAAASVLPTSVAADYPVKADGSNTRTDTTANGGIVKDEGDNQVMLNVSGAVQCARMRSVQVRKPLMSVYDMCKSGHRVTFEFDDTGRDCSVIEHRGTGARTQLHLRGSVWEIDATIIPFGEDLQFISADLCPVHGQASQP